MWIFYGLTTFALTSIIAYVIQGKQLVSRPPTSSPSTSSPPTHHGTGRRHHPHNRFPRPVIPPVFRVPPQPPQPPSTDVIRTIEDLLSNLDTRFKDLNRRDDAAPGDQLIEILKQLEPAIFWSIHAYLLQRMNQPGVQDVWEIVKGFARLHFPELEFVESLDSALKPFFEFLMRVCEDSNRNDERNHIKSLITDEFDKPLLGLCYYMDESLERSDFLHQTMRYFSRLRPDCWWFICPALSLC